MFISKAKTSFSGFIGIILCLFGGGNAGFWFLGIILALTGEIDTDGSAVDEFSLSLTICAISVLILLWGIRKIRLINKAKMLDNIFRGDKDGEIPVKNVATLMAMSEEKFVKLFKKLVAKRYIANASLNNENGAVSIVLNGGKTKNVEYVVMQCQGCSASNTIRKGFVGKCSFCNSDIKGE